MISVTKIPNAPEWKVTLDKKVVGKIIFNGTFFQYFPKGSNAGGEKFTMLNQCIDSLKDES